jgi:hypothetical protein
LLAVDPSTATRARRGTTSLRISRRFPLVSGDWLERPVMFPPGRARLATNPLPIGSLSQHITMGIVAVAACAAAVEVAPPETMTSARRLTSSLAR